MRWGMTLFYLGEFALSPRALRARHCSLRSPAASLLMPSSMELTPGWRVCSVERLTLWLLGYPDQALERSHEALTLAQELAHPFSLAYGSKLCCLAPSVPPGRASSPRASRGRRLRSATEQGFPFWLALGTILRGWALAEQGQGEEGIAQMRQGLAAYAGHGSRVWHGHIILLCWPKCMGKSGRPDRGAHCAGRGIGCSWTRTGERFYEAELYRLKGELTLQQFKVQGSKFKVTELPIPIPRSPRRSRSVFSQSH